MANLNLLFISLLSFISLFGLVVSEDPYIRETWIVEYGTRTLFGVPQQIITVNGLFPGPAINGTSNNNVVLNIFNKLDEPLLFHWNGIQQRKNPWMEGLLGTNCPIAPGTNYTYKFQLKDQIGSYFYYPSTALHRAAGGYGPITIHSRDLIPIPFATPEAEFFVFAGDWYAKSHKELKKTLDGGRSLKKPDGVIINGVHPKGDGSDEPSFMMKAGKTYRFRFCNVGMKNSLNFRIQNHPMKLVEIEGSHTMQALYDHLDVHLGQCLSVLVTADQTPKNYLLVASTRFTKTVLTATATIGYVGGKGAAVAELPAGPDVEWTSSLKQFHSFRWNLTASAARPNPQGSYHYGKINITRTIKFVSTSGMVDNKLRYAINGVSHVDTETPVLLAEYHGVAHNVFKYDIITDDPAPNVSNNITLAPNVINGTFRNFVEIIFENPEKSVQSWHLDGYSFFAVGIGSGKWTPAKRAKYNLIDAISRHTIQVYANGWAAIMLTLDNAGMWNLRSTITERTYLGQQLYISVLSPNRSLRDEYNMPDDFPKCGVVKDMPNPPPYSS